IAAAAGAAILGDNVGDWGGRTLGRRLLLWGDGIGLDQRKLDLGEYLFLRPGGKIVFLARFGAVLRGFAAVLAGANHFPPGRFSTRWGGAPGQRRSDLAGFCWATASIALRDRLAGWHSWWRRSLFCIFGATTNTMRSNCSASQSAICPHCGSG